MSLELETSLERWELDQRRYSNPLVSMRMYIAGLTNAQRLAQASQLVCQPVSTLAALVYASGRPSRSLIISKAARRYNIEPELVRASVPDSGRHDFQTSLPAPPDWSFPNRRWCECAAGGSALDERESA